MSINPMELLKQKVSSVIVNDQTCLVNEKNAILSRFYPILLSRFLANPELIDQLKEKVRPCLSDLLQNDSNQVDINAVIKALNLQIINFATASHQIPEENKAILDKAATLMKNVKDAKLTVVGYTDSTGHANNNKALSLKRAQAVVDYLVSQGVDTAQLSAVGYGADHAVADNATEEGRFKNRRIEFFVSP